MVDRELLYNRFDEYCSKRNPYHDELEEEKLAELFYISAKEGNTFAYDYLGLYSWKDFYSYRPVAAIYRLGLLLYEGVEINGKVIIEKDYRKAAKLLKDAAEKGHNGARLALANMYINGDGIEEEPKLFQIYINNRYFVEGFDLLYISAKDGYDKSLERLQELANLGYTSAHFVLGRLCYDNEDYKQAAEHFKIAAEKGHMIIEARFALGKMYYYGIGVEKDNHMAVEYIRHATSDEEVFYFLKENMANADVAEAQYIIAESYKAKAQVFGYKSSDIEEARKYYEMAANSGIKEAQYEAGHMQRGTFWEPAYIGEEDILAGYYTLTEDDKKAYGEVAKYYSMAIAQEDEEELYHGHAEEKYVLGTLYYYGIGVKQSYEEARKYYEMAARQGHMGAQYKLGTMYCIGYGVESNEDLALIYLKPYADDADEPVESLVKKIRANSKSGWYRPNF